MGNVEQFFDIPVSLKPFLKKYQVTKQNDNNFIFEYKRSRVNSKLCL